MVNYKDFLDLLHNLLLAPVVVDGNPQVLLLNLENVLLLSDVIKAVDKVEFIAAVATK